MFVASSTAGEFTVHIFYSNIFYREKKLKTHIYLGTTCSDFIEFGMHNEDRIRPFDIKVGSISELRKIVRSKFCFYMGSFKLLYIYVRTDFVLRYLVRTWCTDNVTGIEMVN